jgi:hypothetical protein
VTRLRLRPVTGRPPEGFTDGVTTYPASTLAHPEVQTRIEAAIATIRPDLGLAPDH